MPKPDRVSHLEALVRQREGLREPVRPQKPRDWKRIDRELDRIEERVDELLRRLGLEISSSQPPSHAPPRRAAGG